MNRPTQTWVVLDAGTVSAMAYSPDMPPGAGWTAYTGTALLSIGVKIDAKGKIIPL